MNEQELEDLKYPIGRFKKPENFTQSFITDSIAVIANFPGILKKEVENLTEQQLDTPYREDGWTVRQVVHHCADSHMNSLLRFKWALTEEKPTIKPYFEDRFALLPDAIHFPIDASLQILEGTHKRWIAILESLSAEDLQKTFIHPENQRTLTLQINIAIYAWHCNHHLAHITHLKKRMNWL